MALSENTLDEGRLAWIMGSSRSGSTWLLRMLTELDGTVGIDDPHLGHHLGVWRPIPLAWAASKERPVLKQLHEVKREKDGYFFNERYRATWEPLLRELVLGRFGAQAAGSGGPIIVKEPGAQAADLILRMFPRSRLVFLLRDGRDVVDSWLAAYQSGTWAQDEGAFPLAPEGRNAFVRWQAAVWAYRTEAVWRAFSAHDPERRLLVRYEELLADPVGQLERICSVAGVNVTRRELREVAATHDFEAVPDEAKGEDREVRAAQPGGWRANLTPAEQEAMMEELGETLRRFGYADQEAPAPIGASA